MKKRKLLNVLMLGLIISSIACSNKKLLQEENLTLINREIIPTENANTIKLNSAENTGLAIINNVKFEKGSIELEIKGEDKPGQSFVGLAFNIENDTTYEAIYFRPFNFNSKEKIRRDHSVQYISMPDKSWRFLRTNFEGVYESDFSNPPNADDWFSVKIKIDDTSVKVYENKTNTELLSVNRLSKQASNKIALWTGYRSKGVFRNVKIKE